MHFHVYFIRGCDASFLLNSTNNQAKGDAPPNLTVRGFGFLESIKSLVEVESPGVVSYTNIIALGCQRFDCSHNSFSNRLYNFTGVGDQDPALDNKYAIRLKIKCKSLNDNTTLAKINRGSTVLL